jgi:hypothetical protein
MTTANIDDILNEGHLCAIADYHTRHGLKLWLQDNSIPYIEAKSGWPRVHRKALEQAMGVKSAQDAVSIAPVEFNFNTLR